MNQREKIEKEIAEKVMTRLESEKLELGRFDQIKDVLKESKGWLKEAKSDMKFLASVLPKLQRYSAQWKKSGNRGAELEKTATGLLKSYQADAKDLGLTSKGTTAEKNLNEAIDNAREYSKIIGTLLQDLGKL